MSEKATIVAWRRRSTNAELARAWVALGIEARVLTPGRALVEVSPGEVVLSAERGDLQSDEAAVRVSEDHDTPEVRLQLRRKEILRGRLVAGGAPLPGVQVLALPLQGGQLLASGAASTDQDGAFEVRVPAGSMAAEIVAFPPGFALLVQPALLPSSEPIVLHAQTDGGALRLRFPASSGDDAPLISRAAIFTNGGFLDEVLLRQWAGLNGVTGNDAHELFAPELPPGPYRVCRVSQSLPVAARLRLTAGGAGASSLSCVEGEVFAGSELVLRVPED